jgi:L-lactate dehydrogenase complex protein LldG
LIERFGRELAAVGGVFVMTSRDALTGKIIEVLQNRGIDSVMAWADDRFPFLVNEALRQAGITITHEPDAGIRAGLTGAMAGIAETGSLLLCNGPGTPLAASLLPETHIAIIQGEDIRWDLADVFSLQELRESTSAVLVTGPSRTADIEMTLTIGVHGPGEIIVFCIP